MQKSNIELYPNQNQIVRDSYDIMVASLFSGSEATLPKTICITGCEPGVGKTTVSIHLALALSMAGWRTVLIDSDLRKKSEYKRLGNSGLLGLSDYLNGSATYKDILTETNRTNLTLISGGDITTQNPIGLLFSPRFETIMAALQQDNDFVLFDSSPMNCSADALAIAQKASVTFLVAAMNQTTTSLLDDARRQLLGCGAKLGGIIINKVPKREYKATRGAYDYFINVKKRSKRKRKESQEV